MEWGGVMAEQRREPWQRVSEQAETDTIRGTMRGRILVKVERGEELAEELRIEKSRYDKMVVKIDEMVGKHDETIAKHDESIAKMNEMVAMLMAKNSEKDARYDARIAEKEARIAELLDKVRKLAGA